MAGRATSRKDPPLLLECVEDVELRPDPARPGDCQLSYTRVHRLNRLDVRERCRPAKDSVHLYGTPSPGPRSRAETWSSKFPLERVAQSGLAQIAQKELLLRHQDKKVTVGDSLLAKWRLDNVSRRGRASDAGQMRAALADRTGTD